jgi:hypothetical protein
MKSIRIFILGYTFSFGLYYSQYSEAREWYIQPYAGFQTFYNDNIRLFTTRRSTSIDKGAFAFITSAGANMGVRSDRYDIGLNATGIINRYISDFDLNSDNVLLNAKSSFKVTEKNLFRLNGTYSQDSTLASQTDSTGLIQENVIRHTLAINPEWTYSLSNSTSIVTDYNHSDVAYDQQNRNIRTFSDYTSDTASIELSHQWNDALKPYINFSALIVDLGGASLTNYYNANAGLNYRFSETWNSSIEIGIYNSNTESNSDGVTVATSATGPLFLFKTRKVFETSSIDAGYFRVASVRGTGGISLNDQGYLQYSKQLSDQYKIAFNASYFDISGFTSNSNSNASTSYSAGASTSWLISPQFNLTVSYRYTTREAKSTKESAESNAAFLFLNYNWDTFSTSNF